MCDIPPQLLDLTEEKLAACNPQDAKDRVKVNAWLQGVKEAVSRADKVKRGKADEGAAGEAVMICKRQGRAAAAEAPTAQSSCDGIEWHCCGQGAARLRDSQRLGGCQNRRAAHVRWQRCGRQRPPRRYQRRQVASVCRMSRRCV